MQAKEKLCTHYPATLALGNYSLPDDVPPGEIGALCAPPPVAIRLMDLETDTPHHVIV